MLDPNQITTIKEAIQELLGKMTIESFNVELKLSAVKNQEKTSKELKVEELVDVDIKLEEPQFLIGQEGRTLNEFQHILRIFLNKRLQKSFYVNLDINDYKKKKTEYLINLAKELADQVSLTKEKKVLSPMPAYERKIIHTALAERQDVSTESQGESFKRFIIINPR